MPDLRHVDTWIFDLDNTLYPADCNLFRQIDARMAAFIEARLGVPPEKARSLQKDYYVRFGTTLSGLMSEHGVAPDDFLCFVHDIDVSVVVENKTLAGRLAALPGRRFVFTNGSVQHAENVMNRLGVSDAFDDVFDIRAADFTPKPDPKSYEKFVSTREIAARSAAMFEDIALNLEAPHALGMTTILVSSDAEWIADEPTQKKPARTGENHHHVHHVTNDLTDFLGVIQTSETPAAARRL